MKFQPDRLDGVNTIARCDAEGVHVGADLWRRSVLVPWRGDPQAWPLERFDALGADHLAQALALRPEVIIFGSGARLRFPPPAALAAAYAQRVGVEAMDLAAACRTFNVLASEGRKVVAALLIEPADTL